MVCYFWSLLKLKSQVLWDFNESKSYRTYELYGKLSKQTKRFSSILCEKSKEDAPDKTVYLC